MFLRRVLVPVDLSARSERALGYACELAASASAEIDVPPRRPMI